jgi:Protein of unknown function (DUF1572)
MPTSDSTTVLIEQLRDEFRKLKQQAESAMAQIDDRGFFATLAADANSIAVIVKHVGSNLRSRWTDFYDSDGEKPDRNRDCEFEIGPEDTRARLMALWEEGWQRVLDTVDAMTIQDLDRTVIIRWEPHSVPKAILRSLTHTAGHVGQIVVLAKAVQGRAWQTLSIPRGQSELFNRKQQEKFAPRE